MKIKKQIKRLKLVINNKYIIEKCYKNCPENELCEYLYEAYNGENEMLLYYEDIEDRIEFIQ